MNSGIIKLQEYRNEAARLIYNNGDVCRNNDGTFKVKSQSENKSYDVSVIGENYYCECPDYENRSLFLRCKHELATELYILNEGKNYLTSFVNQKVYKHY